MNLYGLIVDEETGTFREDFDAAPARVQRAVDDAIYAVMSGPLPGLCSLHVTPLPGAFAHAYVVTLPGGDGWLAYRVDDSKHQVVLTGLTWL